MNFFAHAVLASERSPDAAFVLGAMLPDLCGFARVRLGGAAGGVLGEGVRFHHASDAAFHAHRAFAARCSELAGALEGRGVRRGPARGVAHVACELQLDGWLALELGVPRAYRDSLADSRALLRECALSPETREDVETVCARVRASPLPEAYASAEFVCERVVRALAQRPFLALASHERPAVAAELEAGGAQCAHWAPGILEDLRRALGRSATQESP